MNTQPMSSPASQPAARPSIVQLALKGKGELLAAYIPLFKEGGIFIAATREYKLGDDVYILLTLPEDTQRYPVTGKVAWITPAHAAGNRMQGVGVRFSSDEKSRMLKATIEDFLGSQLGSGAATFVI
jgi:type IV pilus assembly protein PilZ